MKLTLITCCMLILATTTYSQTPDKGVVQVHYNFIYVQDTTHRDKPLTETMLLATGKNASSFTSYDAIESRVNGLVKQEELRKKGLSDQEIYEAMRGSAIPRQFSSMEYYFFFRDQKFFSKEGICVNGCMVEDRIERPEWKIARDTMSFSGMLCQKATASFKGRNWTAWFAAEIPLESGPWKLNGLPGLILEAYDDKKEVQWKFAGMKNIHEGDMAVSIPNFNEFSAGSKLILGITPGLQLSTVALPAARPVLSGGYMRVTKKEFDKMKVENDRDPQGFRQAQISAMTGSPYSGGGGAVGGAGGGRSGQGGMNFSSSTPARPASPAPPKPIVNNPIEKE